MKRGSDFTQRPPGTGMRVVRAAWLEATGTDEIPQAVARHLVDAGLHAELVATRCLTCNTHQLGTRTRCERCGSIEVSIANITI